MENVNSTVSIVKTRERRSEDEIISLMTEFESSEMTPEEFIEAMNISKQTFCNWQDKYNRHKTGAFTQFKIVEEEQPSEERRLYAEIRVNDHIVISCYEKLDASFIKALI